MAEDKKKQELSSLKMELRSLVVSNPLNMDANNLKRDYYTMLYQPVPFHKYGYKDFITFLNQECTDIFKLSGNPNNPSLIPIIIEEIKHMDANVSRQRIPNTKAYTKKRTSTPQYASSTYRNPEVAQHNGAPSNRGYFNFKWPPSNRYGDSYRGSDAREAGQGYKNYRENRSNYVPSPQKQDTRNQQGSYNSHKDSDSGSVSPVKRSNGREKMKENLRSLLCTLQEGVWAAELMQAYQDMYKEELRYERFSCSSILQMCLQMPDIIKLTRPETNGDFRVFGCGMEVPAAFQDNPNTKRRPPRVVEELPSVDALPGVQLDPSVYPEGFAKFEFSIPRLEPPAVTLKHLPVEVSEVCDPSHFWYHLHSPQHSVALCELMDRMEVFYTNENRKKYQLAPFAMQVGQYCVAVFEGFLHRALIIKTFASTKSVKVLYIDYGTVDSVDCSELFLLKLEFGSFPQQALRGRLHGIRPSQPLWPAAARRRFLGLVKAGPLSANIHSYCQKESVSVMTLVIVNKSEEISVNETLYLEGLAVYEDESGEADCSLAVSCRSGETDSGADSSSSESSFWDSEEEATDKNRMFHRRR